MLTLETGSSDGQSWAAQNWLWVAVAILLHCSTMTLC